MPIFPTPLFSDCHGRHRLRLRGSFGNLSAANWIQHELVPELCSWCTAFLSLLSTKRGTSHSCGHFGLKVTSATIWLCCMGSEVFFIKNPSVIIKLLSNKAWCFQRIRWNENQSSFVRRCGSIQFPTSSHHTIPVLVPICGCTTPPHSSHYNLGRGEGERRCAKRNQT